MEVQIDGKPQESFQTDKDLASGEKLFSQNSSRPDSLD